jgi:BirA family biotin operon repressor/biotin-[acetyl-CoA-carboxylase] ligase
LYDLPALETSIAETIFAGKLHFASTTSSTNTDALAAARSGAPHGSIYFADEQTAGRGRGNHSWHSAAGEGLYVSVLLRPQIPASRLPLLPLAAGLAAADAIRTAACQSPSGLRIDLRWPNDLLIGPHKVGGILVEAGNDSERLPHAVIGIGINVHQRAFAPDLATPATSLDLATGTRISRQLLLLALLKSLELRWRILTRREQLPHALNRLRHGCVGAVSRCMDPRPARVSRPDWMNMVFCAF